jgi:hypothetical protein
MFSFIIKLYFLTHDNARVRVNSKKKEQILTDHVVYNKWKHIIWLSDINTYLLVYCTFLELIHKSTEIERRQTLSFNIKKGYSFLLITCNNNKSIHHKIYDRTNCIFDMTALFVTFYVWLFLIMNITSNICYTNVNHLIKKSKNT